MSDVDSLVDIAVFGIGGAIVMAALIGLLLVASGPDPGASPRLRVGFGVASVALLLVLPTLTAVNTLGSGVGFWQAFATASGAVALVYAVNIALLPVVTRRQVAVNGRAAVPQPRPSLPVLAVGLVICLSLGLLGAGIGSLLV